MSERKGRASVAAPFFGIPSVGTPGDAQRTRTRAGFFVLVLGAFLCTFADAADSIRGRADVRDGDSLQIGKTRVRLWGVDAPEFDQVCRRKAQGWSCGEAATDALRKRVQNRMLDCAVVEIDPHGRSVSRCSFDGKSLNAWLVREGWALDYRRYSKGAYAREESEARAAGRGVWSGPFESPERYRHRSR